MSHSIDNFQGLLLSRHWRDELHKCASDDVQKNLTLSFWLKSSFGPIKVNFDFQQAVFFVGEKDYVKAKKILSGAFSSRGYRWKARRTKLRTFSYERVVAFYFSQQRTVYLARQELRKHGVVPLEADIQPTDRFLMERFVTGAMNVRGKAVDHGSYLEINNPLVTHATFAPVLKVLSLDIETSMDGKLLYSIAACCVLHVPKGCEASASLSEESSVFMLGEENCPGAVNTLFFPTEKGVLQNFLKWFSDMDPDLIIGWNVVNFDLRFLQRRADRLGVNFAIGRNREHVDWRQSRDDEQYYTISIPGRAVLDGIDTLKSATYVFESFSLQFVSNVLLQRGKLIRDADNRGEEITRLFESDKASLAAYNLEDCRLVWEIFRKTELVDFAVERMNMTGLAMDRFGGSVAAFDNRYLPRLHRQGFVAPAMHENDVTVGSPGGYVMDSKPGLYKNILVLDFKSLYPSIIRTFNIDPLALVVGLHEAKNVTAISTEETDIDDRSRFVPGYNGAVFDKGIQVLPDLIAELWRQRDRAKKENNSAMSQAIKILMNSFYGVLGTSGCRFFDFRLPSSITLRGHSILSKTKQLVEQRQCEVIYGDTDSLFVWVKNYSQTEDVETLFSFGDSLVASLNEWWKTFLASEYGVDSALELEFETCFKEFVMPTVRGAEIGSKKRYAGLKIHRDKRQADEIVFKGLEAVRTDWTDLARQFQQELYRRIFCHEPYEEYIRQTVRSIYSGEYDDRLIYRKRIRRNLDDYVRNISPHVQAARVARDMLAKHGKLNAYPRGSWVRYMLTINGPEPVEFCTSNLDYDLYIDRQIAPIVDSIVQFHQTSFDSIAGHQLGLF